MRRRFLPSPLLSIFLFGLWLLLNRSLELGCNLLGLALGLVAAVVQSATAPDQGAASETVVSGETIFRCVPNDIIISNSMSQ